jgi:hypothetical protein
MGIEASYRRVTPQEWARLEHFLDDVESLDPVECYEAYAGVADTDELRASERYLGIDKHWHALHCLLTGQITSPSETSQAPPPLGNVVLGGTETPFDATYGKVRYLTPVEVREVADALAKISVEDLRERFDPVAFTEAEVYPSPRPGGWGTSQLQPLLWVYPQLVGFFRDAAREGNVVLLSLD